MIFNEENYYLYQRQNNDDEYDFKDSWNIRTDEGETLTDYLWSQLITGDFTQEEQEILKFMLECLDSRGYLEEDLEHIAEAFHVSMEKIEFLLETLQSLRPESGRMSADPVNPPPDGYPGPSGHCKPRA